MAPSRESVLELDPLLEALAFGKDSAESADGHTFLKLEGMSTVNGADAWPKSTIQSAMRMFLVYPAENARMFRYLQDEKVIQGPYKTSRMTNGKKSNLELFVVSFRAWDDWKERHAE